MQVHQLGMQYVATRQYLQCFRLIRHQDRLPLVSSELGQYGIVAQKSGPRFGELEEKLWVLVVHLGHECLLGKVFVQL